MDPLVSVYCLAYNHEKYIHDTLEGFVSQKTTFDYEVLVHDDASTDKTAEIIKKYAEKYPDIITPILQAENKYSKHIPIYKNYILPHIKGKYVAVCEGDDYWCDKNKLQTQVDWLESHPEYSCCVHNTKVIDCIDGTEHLINNSTEDKDLLVDEIIQWKKGHLFHTSSLIYRSEFGETPSAFLVKGIGDYPRAVYLATCGKVRYLSDVMSVYRYLTEESWSMKMYSSIDADKRYILHCQDRIAMLNRVNEYTKGKYNECIKEVIRRNQFNVLYRQNEYKEIKKEYKEYYSQLGYRDKIRIILHCYAPFVLRMYSKVHKNV